MENVFLSHFSFLFEALKRNKGRPFHELSQIPVPVEGSVRDLLFLHLWEFALTHDATDAFASLANLTENLILDSVLDMCVKEHAFSAVVEVVRKLETRDGEGAIQRLPQIACASHCSRCWAMRHWILEFLPLPLDWSVCRTKIAKARKDKCWTMMRPKLALSLETDAVFETIQMQSKKGWSCVMFACACVSMWRRWVERRLDPDSTFVNRVLSQRFKQMGVQLQWGGEEDQ